MICYQAMQLRNLADRPRLLGEAKYISILDAAIGFDQLATEPIDIWTTKSVHGITPSPDTHGTEREELDVNRNCTVRRSAKSQVKGGITWGDAANLPSLCIATRGIYSVPICPEECNEPYTYFRNLYVGCTTLARTKSPSLSGVDLRFRCLYFGAVLHRDGAQHLDCRPPTGERAQSPTVINNYVTPNAWTTRDRYVGPGSHLEPLETLDSCFQFCVLVVGEVEPDGAASIFDGVIERLAVLQFLFGGEAVEELADLRGVAEGELARCAVVQAPRLFAAWLVRHGALVTTGRAFCKCQRRSWGRPNYSPIQNPSKRRRMAAQTLPGCG